MFKFKKWLLMVRTNCFNIFTNMITIIYLVKEYGIAFKNKKDATAFVRKNDYNEKKLAYFKNAFNANFSEKDIVELINEKIREVELQ